MKKILLVLFTCTFFSLNAESADPLKQIAGERKTVYEQKSDEEKQAEIEQHVIEENERKEKENKQAWRNLISVILSAFYSTPSQSAP